MTTNINVHAPMFGFQDGKPVVIYFHRTDRMFRSADARHATTVLLPFGPVDNDTMVFLAAGARAALDWHATKGA